MAMKEGEGMLSMKRVGGLSKGNGVDNKSPCFAKSPPGFSECNQGN